MTEREALKLALEFIIASNQRSEFWLVPSSNLNKTVTAIREALAQPEQEPVAWSYWQSCLNDDGTQTAPWVHRLSKFKPTESIINKDVTPLYTTPPQPEPVIDKSAAIRIATSLGWEPKRTWVGLTDEEIDKITEQLDETTIGWSTHEFAQAIEAKLKEKNNG